ncbi:MAG TPA: NAD(P)H dehydrogenase [Erysipelotrichaceae bacterium]|nr:NAD(P)H dehydrogenase [Erysipelotrichaceae bacterium]
MEILFINGSPNYKGNTASLALDVLKDRVFKQVNCIDFQINVYGQNLPGDQFEEILNLMKESDIIIIGSPMYWHNICGSIRTLLDRFYGPVNEGELKGKKLVFVFQGAAPEKWMLDAGDYTMEHFARLYGLDYLGMVTNRREALVISKKI